ncbi:hypothetical protein Ddc_23192 [Ditylenchus destructor]|nr:hypothetical protein Ddc_23192 [Ditylenchus destructor]
MRLFTSPQRAGAYITRMLFLGGAVGFWFFCTQFLRGVLHLRPMQAGIAFLPVTLPNFASAMAVPGLARRFGNETLLLAGLLLGVVGLAWLGQAHALSSYWTGIAPPMVLIGLGQGLLLAPLTAAGVAGVAREDAVLLPAWSTWLTSWGEHWGLDCWFLSSPALVRPSINKTVLP